MMNVMLPPTLILGFLALCIISLREKALDEREQMHIYLAGRFSFLIGIGILVIGILYQSYKHLQDPWLLITLIVMVIARFLIKFYISKKM